MHHDFAAGGIIAFADGGETDLAAQYPEQTTLEQERAERLKNQALYNFGSDPYTEAKRRYSDLEQRQLEREKNAGADRFWAGLSTLASSGTKGFGESMGMAMKTAQDLEEKQNAQGDAQRGKMAELATLWGKEQDALNRANFEADRGNVEGKRKKLLEAAAFRLERQKVQASTTQAEATSKQAETASQKEAREAEAQRQMLPKRAIAGQANRPPSSVEETQRYMNDPKYAAAYNEMQAARTGGRGSFTFEDALKQVAPMMPGESPEAIAAAAKKLMDSYKAYQTGGGGSTMVTLPDGRSLSFPTAQAAAEFKKKAGIQ
ncbi:MAG: hypothetical protein EBR60_09250 [Burkholderiaceae bacterium]|nr:hypothetical protein [Burkholderiaceae bacterium]